MSLLYYYALSWFCYQCTVSFLWCSWTLFVFLLCFQTIRSLDRGDIPTQALVRCLAQKPGFKDNNFQVLKLRLEALKLLAENSDFTR